MLMEGNKMLEDVKVIFSEKDQLLKKLKKPLYESNMEYFIETYGHFITEMTDIVKDAEDKETAAGEMAANFASQVKEAYSGKNGKLNMRIGMDLNFVMIYYVFPALLKTQDENATLIADALKDKWNETMGCGIGYADYDTILSGFRTKIFGMF